MRKKLGNVATSKTGISEDAANLKARHELVQRINEIIRSNGWTQVEAAEYCNAFQPRISHLLRGHIDKFSLDALFNIATRLGLRVDLTVTQVRKNLSATKAPAKKAVKTTKTAKTARR